MAEQLSAFAGDKLDPYVAKIADRVVELMAQKTSISDKLKVETKNLIGLLKKHNKPVIRHQNVEFRIHHVKEKEELKVKNLKPVDGKKGKAKRSKAE